MDLSAVYEAASARLAESNFEHLSESDRVLITVWELEAEVNNGGFDQYFFNSSGDRAFFAERALRMIGADRMADIVARATRLFRPGGVPRDRKDRQEALEEVRDTSEDLLEDLDSQFCDYPDNVESLLRTYLSKARGAG